MKATTPKTASATVWERAGLECLSMLEDQYTCSDREMCDRVARRLNAALRETIQADTPRPREPGTEEQ